MSLAPCSNVSPLRERSLHLCDKFLQMENVSCTLQQCFSTKRTFPADCSELSSHDECSPSNKIGFYRLMILPPVLKQVFYTYRKSHSIKKKALYKNKRQISAIFSLKFAFIDHLKNTFIWQMWTFIRKTPTLDKWITT